MNIEQKLMTLTSEISIDENREQIISLLPQIDQHIFFAEIMLNRVGGLVYYNLNKLKMSHCLCSSYRRICKYLQNSIKIKQRIYERHLEEIILEFNSHKIDYAVIKGLDMVKRIYFEIPYVRDFNDIDILVNKKQLDKIEAILKSLNYTQGVYSEWDNKIASLSREEKIKMRLISHQIEGFTKVIKTSEDIYMPVNIDINFSIFDGGLKKDKISSEVLLKNKKQNILNKNFYYYSLNNYDTIIQLAYHIYRENRMDEMKCDLADGILIKYTDLNEVINKYLAKKEDQILFINYVKNYDLQNEIKEVFTMLNNFFYNAKTNALLCQL